MTYYFKNAVNPGHTQDAVVNDFTSGRPYDGAIDMREGAVRDHMDLVKTPKEDIAALNRLLALSTCQLAYDLAEVGPDYVATVMDAAHQAAALAGVTSKFIRVCYEQDMVMKHVIWLTFTNDVDSKKWMVEGHNRDIVV